MGFQAIKKGLFLLFAIYCYSSSSSNQQHQFIRPISQVAQAFLFHQLQPLSSTPSLDGCPFECHCNKVAQIADCSNRNLVKVPNGFPKDIKRIRLERNNITELGPYAFQGLKRLQRIDLSNNNLVKIDPLAFAGGLQSLNSLILYSNKLNQLPANLFSELSQLQLLLLNANSIQCIGKDLFQSLTNLNLLSLFDNNIETLANGTFDGLKNIRTIHLGKNPLACDCNLRWLADYLELNPIETSEARCESPTRNQGTKLSQLSKQKFKCEGGEFARANQCAPPPQSPPPPPAGDQAGCPAGCVCSGATVDCSRASQSESRAAPSAAASGGLYELPDIPDNMPVYVTQVRLSDNRIKRIRQTELYRRLANSQKIDLGNNKIIDIEDSYSNSNNHINPGAKPERVVFVLLEKEHCSASASASSSSLAAVAARQAPTSAAWPTDDACARAPKVNAPEFDSACYNGGSCLPGPASEASRQRAAAANYSCLCPPGFAGPLCELNLDDCQGHQCQNGAMCVDGINSYKCVCRDPTTSGEFCEQMGQTPSSPPAATANSILQPVALPIIALPTAATGSGGEQAQQQVQARSADLAGAPTVELSACKKVTHRRHYEDGSGCQSVRALKISECVGAHNTCLGSDCQCRPTKVKRRRVRMQCNDGASYVKTVELIKKCGSSPASASASTAHNQLLLNATQEDQLMQITRLDAID